MNNANFGSRFIAYLVDRVALSVRASVISMPFSVMAYLSVATDSTILRLLSLRALLVMVPILILLQFAYLGYLRSSSPNGEGWHDKTFSTRIVRA